MDEKIYFKPGELVVVKHSISPKPVMVVKKINKTRKLSEDNSQLLGVLCYWFSDDLCYQEELFSTKDLEKINY